MLTYEGFSGGHAMYYKVENGTVKFYDGQIGQPSHDKTFALADPKSYSWVRLDNAKVNDEVGNHVVSKKGKKDK